MWTDCYLEIDGELKKVNHIEEFDLSLADLSQYFENTFGKKDYYTERKYWIKRMRKEKPNGLYTQF